MKPTPLADVTLDHLRCPRCKSALILYRRAIACSDMGCGGMFDPVDIGVAATMKRLREKFPTLCSLAPVDQMRRPVP